MSQRARRRHRRSRGSVGKKVLLVFGVLLGDRRHRRRRAAALWVQDIRASAPSIDTLEAGRERRELRGLRRRRLQPRLRRRPTSSARRSSSTRSRSGLRNATIAIEDENFYEHDGVDYSAIVRAAVENIEAGEVKQGASTITQQLVRNLYIEDPEDTIERKIIEAEMAREYEEEYTKDEILEQYLNTASYGTNDGRTAVGVEAASQVFFNKDVSDLNLSEAALLAGLPQAPTDYNPFLNPDGAKDRRATVLKAMDEQGYISGGAVPGGARRRARARARLPVRDPRAAVLLRLRPAGADRPLRRRDRARGRPRGLHDARPAAAGRGRAGDRRPAHDRRRRGGAGLDRHRDRRDPRDGLLGGLRGQPVQPRRPGHAPAGLGVQAVRAHRPRSTRASTPTRPTTRPRARSRSTIGYGEPWTVSGGGGGSMSLRDGDRELGQHRLRPARARRRRRELHRDGAADGDHQPSSAATRPRCSAASRRASRCSRCRTPSRRSPTAASTTTRPRSSGSSSPTARSTSPRTPRARG